MNNLTIFSSNEFGQIRTMVIDGEPWFVASDIARSLGYSDPHDAIKRHVDADDKLTRCFTDSGQKRNVIITNESGMYSLVFGSHLESAKQFKKWVTSEVLPTLRKTGTYELVEKKDSYLIEDRIERAKRWIEEQQEKERLEATIEEQKPKVEVFDKLIESKLLVNFRDAAKEIGISQSQFTGWLKDNGYVYANSKGELRPMEAYMESELFTMKPYVNPYNGFSGNRTFLTPKGLATFKVLLDGGGLGRTTMRKHGGRKKVAT